MAKYYLSIEQRGGIINRIPIKEEDPDMQGILDALIKMYRIIEEVAPEDPIDYEVLIDTIILRIDCLYIETVETYDGGLQEIRKQIPLGNTDQCVRNLLQIIQYNDAFDLAANNLALEIKNSVGFHWRQLNPGSSTPEPEFINQFYEEVINRLKTKI